MREAYNAVVVRAEPWAGTAYTEPYEVGWASEAVLFAHAIEVEGESGRLFACISPDGVHWADEGTVLDLPSDASAVRFARLREFGHFLRFRAELPDGARAKYVITLSLKE